MANTELMDTEDELKFYKDVHAILDEAKSKTYEAANNIMTYAYRNVGKRIIEQEQKGDRKAKYGSYLIKRLSQELSDEYGTGFSVANIRNCRQLYLTFPKESYGYSDTIYVSYDRKSENEDRILEDDIITIYGKLGGLETYTSILGADITLPQVFAEYIEIEK